MKTSTNKLTYGLSIAALALVLSIGVSYVLAATYTEPTCAPPGCNTDAPLNVGASTQEKLGSLAINTQIPSLQTGLSVWGISNFFGSIKIADGTQGAGKVLTSDANGLASWTTSSGGSGVGLDQLCKTVTTGVATTGYTPIDLVINGKNICSDANGCSYRIWQSNTSGVIDLYGNNAYLLYQDLPTASPWRDSQGNNGGINGDSTTKDMTGNWDGGYLMDDSTAAGGETSPSQFTFRDNTTTRGFAVTICDL